MEEITKENNQVIKKVKPAKIKKLKNSEINWLNALTGQSEPYKSMALDAIIFNDKEKLESLNRIFKNQQIWVKNPQTGEFETWFNGKLA